MADLVAFQHVVLGYRHKTILADLNFEIREGEFFGIVGANGSGKTTLLRAMLGILPPLRGSVQTHITRFGYVPQQGFLDEIYPLTTREVVSMGRYGIPGGRVRERETVDRSLTQTGLTTVADHRFRELSGGQRQRALIARALAVESPVLVLDEPTDGMDLEGQQSMLTLIDQLRAASGITVIYVTHRLNELANAADRLLLLHAGAVRLGAASEILRAEVLRETYGIDARVVEVEGQRVILT